MDLVDFDEARFREIERDALELAERLGVPDVRVVPISALEGDNVVERSERTPYYDGPPLLELLETVEVARDRNLDDVRLPIQWVVRPRDAKPGEHRLYAGQVAAGVIRAGDEIAALPEGARTRIEAIDTADGPVEEALPADVGDGAPRRRARRRPRRPARRAGRRAAGRARARGDDLLDGRRAAAPRRAATAQAHDAHGARDRRGAARARGHRVARRAARAGELGLNDIGRIRLLTSAPVMADPYARNRVTGAFMLVDELTHDTVAAGMVRSAKAADSGMEAELAWEAPPLEREERWDALATRGATVWLRATPELIAEAGAAVERALVSGGRSAYLIDGGVSQQGLPPGRLARLLADSGIVAVAALPAASAEVRREARELHAAADLAFLDLHVPDGESPERTAERALAALDLEQQRQQQDDHDEHEQDRAGRGGLPLVLPEARLGAVARVAALGGLADPVVVVGHQSNTRPIETRVTLPPRIRKSVTTSPTVKRPVWQERKPAIVSQRTPRTRAFTVASVEPTPTPRAVRSPRPVVETVLTSRRPWKSTVIPPRKRHCRNGPKSFVPERVDAGAPSAARTSARELPRRAPAMPRSTWISASAAAGAPRGASSAAATVSVRGRGRRAIAVPSADPAGA